jgi:hypothetical protein
MFFFYCFNYHNVLLFLHISFPHFIMCFLAYILRVSLFFYLLVGFSVFFLSFSHIRSVGLYEKLL